MNERLKPTQQKRKKPLEQIHIHNSAPIVLLKPNPAPHSIQQDIIRIATNLPHREPAQIVLLDELPFDAERPRVVV